MKIKAGNLIVLILFSTILPIQAATNEGYGEDETSLGQFVDSFEDLDNVSVAVNVVRNSTLDAMELNYSSEGGAPTYTFEADGVGAVPAGWLDQSSAACSARVSTDTAHGGTKSVKMVDSSATGWSRLWIQNQFDVTEVTYYIFMSATSRVLAIYTFENAVNSDILAIVQFSPDGNVDAFDGVVATELISYSAARWYKVRIVFDLGDNSYDVYIDDVLEANDFDYFNGPASSFKSCKFQSGRVVAGGTQGYIDDVTIGTTDGYPAEGYFTTVDYLSDPLANGSALVQLTNTSIPDGTQILVEFSEDNSTWILNDWQPIFGGFEAIDLRDLNYSTGFQVRFNMSTSNSSRTPRVYQNRLITTRGNSTTQIQNITGEWVEYRASAINASVGVVDGGDLNSTFEIDGDTFNVSEVVGAPGMLISINFTGIDPDAECVWITIWYLYDGNLNHVFEIEVWNFTSSAWVTDGLLVDTAAFEWINSTIYALRIPNEFLSGGELRVQLNHETPGNINHDLFIDYIRLIAEIPSDVAPAEPFQFFWIVIAIALMIVGIVLARMWPKEGDP